MDEGLAGSWLDGAGEEELACLAPVLGEFPISNLVWSCDKMFRSLLVHFGATGQRAGAWGDVASGEIERFTWGERLAEKRGRFALAAMASGLYGEVDEKSGSDLMEAFTHTTPALSVEVGLAQPHSLLIRAIPSLAGLRLAH